MKLWSTWNMETGEMHSMTMELDTFAERTEFRNIMSKFVDEYETGANDEFILAVDILDAMTQPEAE